MHSSPTTHRVMRHLLGDVVSLRSVGVVVRAAEELVQHRVVRLLDTVESALIHGTTVSCNSPTGLDVPSGEVERKDVEEAVTSVRQLAYSVLSAGIVQACSCGAAHPKIRSGWEKKSVMRSRSERGSRTNVGSAILVRSMPGRTACQLIRTIGRAGGEHRCGERRLLTVPAPAEASSNLPFRALRRAQSSLPRPPSSPLVRST